MNNRLGLVIVVVFTIMFGQFFAPRWIEVGDFFIFQGEAGFYVVPLHEFRSSHAETFVLPITGKKVSYSSNGRVEEREQILLFILNSRPYWLWNHTSRVVDDSPGLNIVPREGNHR